MSRATLKRNHRKICVGDMKDQITLQTRVITPAVFGSRDFSETFTDFSSKVWAKVRTINGRVLFNGVDTDVDLSHEITIRYDASVTAETWILLDDAVTRLDIVDSQNPEERNEYLILLCKARGTQEASKA